ncbi:hypothetical protein RRG08_052111 [Elysia crispata]|uniref:Uncharacterized protein n=1 Tax=Elysia crispata TaxID=231223 RepID=A0AAE1A4T6_9GAST|nr:hypothetical protein RRG08_052111 [Elysia crispata]
MKHDNSILCGFSTLVLISAVKWDTMAQGLVTHLVLSRDPDITARSSLNLIFCVAKQEHSDPSLAMLPAAGWFYFRFNLSMPRRKLCGMTRLVWKRSPVAVTCLRLERTEFFHTSVLAALSFVSEHWVTSPLLCPDLLEPVMMCVKDSGCPFSFSFNELLQIPGVYLQNSGET